MRFFFSFFLFILVASVSFAEDSKLLSWSSTTAIDTTVKRVFKAKFQIKLGDKWKGEKPEVLIKTLDKEECVMQISNVVKIENNAQEIELTVPYMKDFQFFRLCLRTKNNVEYFKQTWQKKEKEPILEVMDLERGANVIFFKKMEADLASKNSTDCRVKGVVINAGSGQAKNVSIKMVIKDALGSKIKELGYLLVDHEKKPIILDGGEKFSIDHVISGTKGFAGGSFDITFEGAEQKEIVVDSGIVTTAESVFEYGKNENEVSITKVVAKMINVNDLSLKITIYNGLGKTMMNPVITIKLTNDKGEVIQPIDLEFEGELGSKETAEIPFEHKGAPAFNGISQSIRYSTK